MKFMFAFFLLSSFAYGEIDVHFIIDENYLITHTLSTHSFSSDQDKSTIIAFQDDVWRKDEIAYRLLPNQNYLTPELSCHPSLHEFITSVKFFKSFRPILEQTLAYKDFCQNQWNATYPMAKEYISEMTGLELDKKTFEIYLTHPGLRNGLYLGDHKIAWGCSGDFAFYDTVYIWHEILHSYLPGGHIAHCLIQFLADNGLRALLNKEKSISPLVSHLPLLPLMKALYPKWEEYIKKPDRDIFALLKELETDELIQEKARSVQWYSL